MGELVAGVDSSTQSCKVVVRDAESGELVRSGRAVHPDGTEIDPKHWWAALQQALDEAGGLADVAAVSVAGQQHGMVCLDETGEVVRPALLWNDTRSAPAAAALVEELGAQAWADATGTVPVASITVTKLRWLAENEPANAARTAAVCLPHDWLTWQLAGGGADHRQGAPGLDALVTDRSDASGTGYFDASSGEYRRDLLRRGLGRDDVVLPRVLGPTESIEGPGFRLGPGAGDNAGAALGLGAGDDVVVSLGTSGVVSARGERQGSDPTGTIAGFADATGAFLPLVVTLNAARVLDAAARMLGVDHTGLSRLALSAPPGAEGLTLVPYLEGERTPNLPHSTGAIHGMTLANATPANLARAAIEGMLSGQKAGVDALAAVGVHVHEIMLIGGAARSEAVRRIAPTVFGVPVVVPEPGEYVADGAARQAAWVLAGGSEPPAWATGGTPERHEGELTAGLEDRYREAAEKYLPRPEG
ncbi:xylulose kinase [Pseudonocardia sp. RS11V-5]|uniref:xylulokinase n=1 Tax=Pseudonocardia terrae TaxID=2905831 RepID=UPI001E2F5B1D|nr:FGGY family carbohydrate kinase [Pseudonocardia terrae]MCE3550950.1 xylulose kinase [Pseudonocardia terrae]